MLVRAALALGLAGCINTDPAVFVDASVASTSIAVTTSSLVAGLEGSFALSLHLGARASGPSTTDVTSASLVSDDGTQTLASTLGFTAAPDLPVTVPTDGTVTVAMSLGAKDNALPADAASTLCSAPARIRVVLLDSLRGVPTTVDSEAFTPTGCK